MENFPANNYLFKVNKRDTRKRFEICSNLTIITHEQRYCLYCLSWVFFAWLKSSVVNLESLKVVNNFDNRFNLILGDKFGIREGNRNWIN